MPIHPLRQIRYETEREKFIIDGSIAATEELGIFYYVGYSFCLLAELYVVQRNAEKVNCNYDSKSSCGSLLSMRSSSGPSSMQLTASPAATKSMHSGSGMAGA